MTKTILGFRLRELRLKSGLSLGEVGRALKLYSQTIQNWEVGRASPTHRNLMKLASYYNVEVNYLLGTDIVLPRLSREAVSKFPENSHERANAIINQAFTQMGWNKKVDLELPSLNKYLADKLTDDELYREVQEQLYIMSQPTQSVLGSNLI